MTSQTQTRLTQLSPQVAQAATSVSRHARATQSFLCDVTAVLNEAAARHEQLGVFGVSRVLEHGGGDLLVAFLVALDSEVGPRLDDGLEALEVVVNCWNNCYILIK